MQFAEPKKIYEWDYDKRKQERLIRDKQYVKCMGAETFQKAVRLILKNENRGADDIGSGNPLPSQLGCLGERRELHRWGPEQSPSRQRILSIF